MAGLNSRIRSSTAEGHFIDSFEMHTLPTNIWLSRDTSEGRKQSTSRRHAWKERSGNVGFKIPQPRQANTHRQPTLRKNCMSTIRIVLTRWERTRAIMKTWLRQLDKSRFSPRSGPLDRIAMLYLMCSLYLIYGLLMLLSIFLHLDITLSDSGSPGPL
jgi:hypothetical protein